MLRYVADENSNNDIFRGLRRRDDHLDVVRVQDVDLSSTLDPILLDWAARPWAAVQAGPGGTRR